MKKDHHCHRAEEKPKQADVKKDDEQDARATIGEIRTIKGGPVTRGSFKSLLRAHKRQVNSVHAGHLMTKCRSIGAEDIVFSEYDATRAAS